MMKKEIISIPAVKVPVSPFNHVVKAGGLLFLTSQLSCDLKTGAIISGDIAVQTTNALENIKFLLEASGSCLDNILKSVIYMRDVGEFNQMDRIYRKYFKPGQEPARVTIQSPSPIAGINIEIEVTAVISD